jgi:hypothetical protein
MTKILDRISIIELVNLYARYADRREAEKQSQLFTKNAIINVYQGEPDKHQSIQTLQGHEELKKGFSGLNDYDTTTHFNGQTSLTIDNDHATGETYCLAHHLKTQNGQRTLTVMSIHYYDTFIKENDKWLFSERKLIIDWTDSRQSNP